jgi:hypothetical protein
MIKRSKSAYGALLTNLVDKTFSRMGTNSIIDTPVGFVIVTPDENVLDDQPKFPSIIIYTGEQVAGFPLEENEIIDSDDIEWNAIVKRLISDKAIPDIRDVIKLATLIQNGTKKGDKQFTLMKNFKYTLTHSWVCRFSRMKCIPATREEMTSKYIILNAVDYKIGISADWLMSVTTLTAVNETDANNIMTFLEPISANVQ